MNLLPPQDLYSEILPGLWQGGTGDFDTLEFPKEYPIWKSKREFDSVATLYAIAHPVGWHVKELRYGFGDGPLNETDKCELNKVAEWAYNEFKAGKKLGIRCQMGINRSRYVAARVLLMLGYEPREAISVIREKRSNYALNNRSFEEAILKC